MKSWWGWRYFWNAENEKWVTTAKWLPRDQTVTKCWEAAVSERVLPILQAQRWCLQDYSESSSPARWRKARTGYLLWGRAALGIKTTGTRKNSAGHHGTQCHHTVGLGLFEHWGWTYFLTDSPKLYLFPEAFSLLVYQVIPLAKALNNNVVPGKNPTAQSISMLWFIIMWHTQCNLILFPPWCTMLWTHGSEAAGSV